MSIIEGVDPLTGSEVLGGDSTIEWLKERFELAIKDPNSYYSRFIKPAEGLRRPPPDEYGGAFHYSPPQSS